MKSNKIIFNYIIMPPKKVVKKKATQKQKQKQTQYVKVVINQPIKRKSRPVAKKQSAPVYAEPRVQMLVQQPTAQDIASQYHMLTRVQSQAKTDILEPKKETADINLIRSLREDLLSRIDSLAKTELLPSERIFVDDSVFTPRVPTTTSDSVFAGLTVKQLKEELKSRGMPSSGNKADLIARLESL